MTRPDPRLIVPCDALPFVPAGALVIDEDGRRTIATLDDLTAPRWGRSACVDLSAPARRDGLDERLDVLGWALRWLGWIRPVLLPTGEWFAGGLPHAGTDFGDLSNLTTDEQARAVVAAALRARGGSNG